MRDYQLARHLGKHTALTFVEMCQPHEIQTLPPRDCSLEALITLQKHRTYGAARVLRGLIGPTPVTVLNCWSREMASALAGALRTRKFDAVQIQGVHLISYLPYLQSLPASPCVLVDWHNIESELMWRFAECTRSWVKKAAARRTAILIERAENQLLGAGLTHTVTSVREQQKLLARFPTANIHVIPNGVDVDYYSAEKIAHSQPRTEESHVRNAVLFVGSMDYHANVDAVLWFVRTAWPRVLRDTPDLHLHIVGRDPVAEIRELASDRAHVSGTVADVRPFYNQALISVVPLRSGSGTRLKILESMAAGVPVVSTRLGAEGLEVAHDVHLLLADSASEFAAATTRLVSSPETRARLSEAALKLVRERYDWKNIAAQLHQIHCNQMQSRQSTTHQLAS